jgi:hypothetical protein
MQSAYGEVLNHDHDAEVYDETVFGFRMGLRQSNNRQRFYLSRVTKVSLGFQ